MKKIILLVHGFMVHDSHDFTWFFNYVTTCEKYKNLEFKLVKLYERENPKTSKPKNMYKVLKNEVLYYQSKGYDVSLIGYSFSCVLVSKVAKDLKLKAVIYFAPSLKLIKTNLFKTHIKNAFKSLKLRLKHGKEKAKKIMERTKTSGVVILSLHIFLTMLKYRKTFNSKTNFFILRGADDTYCLQSDIVYILKKTKANHIKTLTIKGKDWNHFFVRRDYLNAYEAELVYNFFVNENFVEGEELI